MDKISALLCGNCGFKFTIDPKNTTAICPSCGACFSVSDDLKEKPQNTISAKPKNGSKISRLGKITLIFAVISIIVSAAAAQNKMHSAVQAVIYLILFTFFLGIQVIAEKEKRLHILTFILGALLIIPFSISCVSCTESKPDVSGTADLSWNELILSERLPELDFEKGYISKNTEKELIVNIYGIPREKYQGFVEGCKELGFTIKSKENNDLYYAAAENGSKLRLRYWELHGGTVGVELLVPDQA